MVLQVVEPASIEKSVPPMVSPPFPLNVYLRRIGPPPPLYLPLALPKFYLVLRFSRALPPSGSPLLGIWPASGWSLAELA